MHHVLRGVYYINTKPKKAKKWVTVAWFYLGYASFAFSSLELNFLILENVHQFVWFFPYNANILEKLKNLTKCTLSMENMLSRIKFTVQQRLKTSKAKWV
jgi:hypothetical protein